MSKKPNFFIVGAPRCGTTAMYEYLKLHPQIYMSSYKEPHYFATDLVPPNSWTAKYRNLKDYLNLFSNVTNEQIIGEASVLYLYSKEAAKNIYKFNPTAKILIMLRNPIDVMYSIYNLHYSSGSETANNFNLALKLEKERKKNNIDLPKNKLAMKYFYYYKDLVYFNKQIKRYQKIFKKNQIMFINFDDFAKNTDKIYQETLKFLEVESDFKPIFKRINQVRIVKSIKFLNLTQKLAEKFSFLDSNNFRRLYKIYLLFEKMFSKKINYSPIDKKKRKDLSKEFKNEIQNLSKTTKMNLNYWYK